LHQGRVGEAVRVVVVCHRASVADVFNHGAEGVAAVSLDVLVVSTKKKRNNNNNNNNKAQPQQQ
jgi:hypothetical protein